MIKKLPKEMQDDLYRQLVENHSDLVVQFNVEGYLLYANPAYLHTFGKTEEELVGQKFFSLIHDQDLNNIEKSLRKTLFPPYTTQHRERAKTKHGWRWFSWYATGIPNEEGQVSTIISIGHDITDQVEAEEKLRESEERFRRLFETSPLALLILDMNGKITSCNPALISMTGYKYEEIIGSDFTEIPSFLPGNQTLFKQLFRDMVNGKPLKDLIVKWSRSDGEERIGLFNYSLLKEKDELKEIQIIIDDITEREKNAERIQQEQAKSQQYLDVVEAILLALDKDQRVVLANRKCCEVLGYEEQEILGKHWIENFIPKQIQPNVKKGWEKILDRNIKETEYVENKVLTKDGKERIVAWHNAVLQDEHGKITGTLSSGQDITEQKKAEEQLRQSEEKFRASFEDSVVGMAIVGINGNFISINQAVCQTYGYTKEELLKLSFIDITHPEDIEKSRKSFQQCLENHEPYTIEKRYIKKDGEYIIGLTSVSPIIDSQGSVQYVIAHTQNITKRKQYENELIKERNKAQQYLDIAEVIILALDTEQRITLANRKCCEVLGYEEEDEVLGKKWVDTFIPEKDRETVTAIWGKIMQDKIDLVEYAENPIITRDGKERIIAWHNAVLTDTDGKLIGTLSSGVDITKRKQAETAIYTLNKELEERVELRTAQLIEANKELEAFAYSVSHDLQAPLRAIRGFTQIIELEYSKDLPEGAAAYFERIKNATTKMNQLIQGLLDLSRMGQKTLALEEIDIDQLAEKIFQELVVLEQNREITFTACTHKIINGDKEMISILLKNLIDNAIKYTRLKKKAIIEFGCRITGSTETFYISDNGIGFSMNFADKLFQPFQRLHTDEEFDGTGIGLSLARRIILHHNGNIWIYSEEKKGTTIYFTIGQLEPEHLPHTEEQE